MKAATSLVTGVRPAPELAEEAVNNALDKAGFILAESLEVLNRSWHIEGNAVRPDHRMVAHTGFLTTARRGSDQ